MGRGAFSQGIGIEDDALLAIALGNVPNMHHANIIAFKDDIATEEEDLTGVGVNYVFPPTSGEVMTIVSTAVGDTGQTVVVQGLDENLEEAEITVVTDGLTPVTLPGVWARINRARLLSGPDQVGEIRVEGTNVYALLRRGQSFDGVYTSPAKHDTLLLDVTASMLRSANQDSGVVIRLYSRSLVDGVEGPWILEAPFAIQQQGTSDVDFGNIAPEVITGPTDYRFTAEATSAGTGMTIRISFTLRENYA